MTDNRNFVQAQKFALSGSGMASGATSFTLKSFQLPDGSTNIAMTDFGAVGYGTLEPNTSREESVSWTGVTQNGDGTATLTGVSTGLDFTAPYTSVAANKKAHAGGSVFVVSNTATFYDTFVNKENDETINGKHTYADVPDTTAGDPVADNDLARKAYVDSVVTGSFPSERTVVEGTAGETIADGDLIYFDTVTNNEWMKCDANTAATVDNVILGIAQGAGVNGGAISGGVLVKGIDDAQSGLTGGNIVYASDTAGAISESPGTVEVVIGAVVAGSTTKIYFEPRFQQQLTEDQQDALVGSSGTPSSANTYVTTDDVSDAGVASKIVRLDSSSNLSTVAQVDLASLKIASEAQGDTIIRDGSGFTRLAAGTANQYLQTQGASSNPVWASASHKIAVVTTNVVVQSSTTETDLISVSIPANTLGTNNAIRARLYISDLRAATSETMTFRSKYGSTTMVTMALTVNITSTIHGWLEFMLYGDGATNVQEAHVLLDVGLNAVSAGATVTQIRNTQVGTAAEDSTGALTLAVSAQHSNSSSTDTVTLQSATIELIG